MTKIKAPFNFVPLSKEVYFPDWANDISLDAPFSDGISGTIELKITAKSPIFVRNGHSTKDAEDKNEKYKSFSKTNDGKYFIPATSIKGAIRNVLEIMSFGKIKLDRNAMFAQREWNNPELYTLKKEQEKLYCGYLCQNGGKYEIVDCGEPYRISHDKIDLYLEDKIFKKHFSKSSQIDLAEEQLLNGKKFDPKTACFKYELTKGHKPLTNLKFSLDQDHVNKYNKKRLKVDENGEYIGDIIYTGQPDKWTPRPATNNKAGKFYEFVFLHPEKQKKYSISEETYNHFKFIYSKSTEWKRIDSEKKVPVFFRIEKEKVKDFGLAFLYKLPYAKSPYDSLSENHKKKDLDLAECMFGHTDKDNSLRGRILFSNAFAEHAEQDKEIKLALGSPKASYYPIYIIQDRTGCVTTYKTYNDGEISGWKRYPIRTNTWENATKNDNIDTIIYPLKANTEFTCHVSFFNLRPIELGALLSALTFHGDPECYHQLGQAKPFGYGKSKFEISALKFHDAHCYKEIKKNDWYKYMPMFEKEIDKKIGNGKWCKNQSIIELFTMAHCEVTTDNLFTYMNMNTKNENDFLSAKEEKEYLCSYSEIIGNSYSPKSQYTQYLTNAKVIKEKAENEKSIESYEKAILELKKDQNWSSEIAEYINELVKQEKELKDKELYEKHYQEVIALKEEAIKSNDISKYQNVKLKYEELFNLHPEHHELSSEITEISDSISRLKKANKGLDILNEKYNIGQNKDKFKVNNFKSCESKVTSFLKSAGVSQIPDDQIGILKDAIVRLRKNPDKKEKKGWENFDSNIWLCICKWIGEKDANDLFNL